MKESEKIWFDGKFIPWQEAKIHVLSHVIHYGSSVFEGIRCYNTVQGPAVFCLDKHLARLYDSAKIYQMEIPYSRAELREAILETIRVNRLKSCYIRPVVFRGYGSIGVNPLTCPVNVAIAVIEWGAYLGSEAIEQGVDVRVSSWRRVAPGTIPSMAKAGGNYLSSQLMVLEALRDGYREGISLDAFGYLSEGSGENLFIIKNGIIYTPLTGQSILPGITRECALALARDFGYEIREEPLLREFLYIADEIFFTGTAAEITPIRSVDKIKIGSGTRGPITERIQAKFFAITSGKTEDKYNWLTSV